MKRICVKTSAADAPEVHLHYARRSAPMAFQTLGSGYLRNEVFKSILGFVGGARDFDQIHLFHAREVDVFAIATACKAVASIGQPWMHMRQVPTAALKSIIGFLATLPIVYIDELEPLGLCDEDMVALANTCKHAAVLMRPWMQTLEFRYWMGVLTDLLPYLEGSESESEDDDFLLQWEEDLATADLVYDKYVRGKCDDWMKKRAITILRIIFNAKSWPREMNIRWTRRRLDAAEKQLEKNTEV
jgi:hypothetical protein